MRPRKSPPKSPRKSPLEWIEDQHRDLGAENEMLRAELRKALNLEPARPRRLRARFRAARGRFRRYIVIPDTQVSPGVPTDHLEWAGRYIAEKRPDVIVHLGDHFDFPSLSTHSSDVNKAFRGVDYAEDIRTGNEGLARLTAPYRRLKDYKPEEHFILGNHEDRLTRTVANFPHLRGVMKLSDMNLDGWEVHEFLRPVELDGVLFAHYFANPFSGRPIGGTAHNLLRYVGKSCVQGHKQTLDCAIQQLPDGTQRRATIAGAFYTHDEDYKGPQGNGHFRGPIVMNEVNAGMWDQLEVSVEFLRRKFG